LFFPAALSQLVAGPEGAKNLAGKCPPPDSDPFNGVDSEENYASLSKQFAASTDHRFEFQKRSQLFVSTHNETLSVAAMRATIQIVRPLESTAENPAQTPSGLAEFVGNQLPILHESISQIFMCFSFLMHTRNRRFAFRETPPTFPGALSSQKFANRETRLGK